MYKEKNFNMKIGKYINIYRKHADFKGMGINLIKMNFIVSKKFQFVELSIAIDIPTLTKLKRISNREICA